MAVTTARRNIALCLALVALWATHFSVAVTVAFYELFSFNQTATLRLVAITATIGVVFEIPSGFLSDKIGDRRAILISSVAKIIASAGMGWWASSYWEFAVVTAAIGFAWSLSSGTDRSIINKTTSPEQAARYSFYAAQARAAGGLVGLGIGSALVAYDDVTLPFKLQPITFIATFCVALALKETHSYRNHVHIGQIRIVWREIFVKQRRLKWLALIAALVNASALASMWMVQTLLKAANVDVEWFGFVFVVRAVATIIIGFAKDRWMIKLGTLRMQTLVLLAVSGTAWFAALPTSWIGAVLILVANAMAAAFTDALMINAANSHLAHIKYASTTTYSIISALQALAFVPISLGLGPISDDVSPNMALMAISAVTLLPGWYMLRQLRTSLQQM